MVARYRYVTNMGAVFRLTNKQYTELLRRVASGADSGGVLYGEMNTTMLGECLNVTDMGSEEAQYMLEGMAK